MELTPEDRQRIYLEEKARLEAQQKIRHRQEAELSKQRQMTKRDALMGCLVVPVALVAVVVGLVVLISLFDNGKGNQSSYTNESNAAIEARIIEKEFKNLTPREHLTTAEKLLTKDANRAAVEEAKKHLLTIGQDSTEAKQGSTLLRRADARLKAIEREEHATKHEIENRQRPTFLIDRYLLEPPERLTDVLGTLQRRTECVDTDGIQLEYQHGYACTQNGRVALISYDLQRTIANPQEALAIVGLNSSVAPTVVGFGAARTYRWMRREGNGLRVKGQIATRVMVILGPGGRSVIVNLGNE